MTTRTKVVALDRRGILCGGGAVVFEVMLASKVGGAPPVRTEELRGPVPTVDHLAVRVVIDSYQIAVAPSGKSGNVEIRRLG
jgi:7,8-dihydropterin-6-yl-methyl-4-(beta-D-ribofuranosyl)aminobenzene 5'-phosphate synthase